MKILGLTGGSGSGKSEIAKIFSSLGADVIDCDAISREITQKGKRALFELRQAFGEGIFNKDGTLNRRELGRIAFADGKKVQLLNEITHKYILEEIEKRISNTKAKTVVIDAPLLFEAKLEEKCDAVLAISAPYTMRIFRIMERDSITEEEAKKRISVQMTDEEYASRSAFVIKNDKDKDSLKRQVINFYYDNIGE